MASILSNLPLVFPPSGQRSTFSNTSKPLTLSFKPRCTTPLQPKPSHFSYKSHRFPTFLTFASYGETAETDKVEEEKILEDSDDEVATENVINDGGFVDAEEKMASVVLASLQSYKEALANDDKSTVAEIEAILLSIEDEKTYFENKVSTLSEEIQVLKDKILRISADFDNFRKRTERDRLSLVTNAQGEVVESLLPVLDNFERAKTQIKVETDGEEKINNSYQSIYKQFIEILDSLGVAAVETVGNAFDPLLHEAIMREESTEFEEGIILQEFRKGFKLGDRLLRPGMVKVSAGPGPSKPEEADPSGEPESGGDDTSQKSSIEDGEPV